MNTSGPQRTPRHERSFGLANSVLPLTVLFTVLAIGCGDPETTGDDANIELNCTASHSCDCASLSEARPLNLLSTSLGDRRVSALCFDSNRDELRVLNYSVQTVDGEVFPHPDVYYETVLSGSTLALVDENLLVGPDEFELSTFGSQCAPDPPDYLSGNSGGFEFRATIEQVDDETTGARWYRQVLHINDQVALSFNEPFNQGLDFADTNPEVAMDFAPIALVGRVQDDGLARFYFYRFTDGLVDLIVIDDLPTLLANTPSPEGDEPRLLTGGFATARVVIEGRRNIGSYPFEAIFVAPASVDPSRDQILVLANPSPDDGLTGVRGLLVAGGSQSPVEIEVQASLSLASGYDRSIWHSGGTDSRGVLFLQSSVAEFDTSIVAAIDTASYSVLDTWELDCLGPPAVYGFQALPWAEGQLIRFSWDQAEDDQTRMMFIHEGVIEAIGDVSLNFYPRILLNTGPDVGLVFTANELAADVSRIEMP